MNTNTMTSPSTSPSTLATLAQQILEMDLNRNYCEVRRLLDRNPLLAYVMFSFTYSYDEGSDCCWTITKKGALTIGEYVMTGYGVYSIGNRSYNFGNKQVTCADESKCAERKELVRLAEVERFNKQKEEALKKQAVFDRALAASQAVASRLTLEKRVYVRGGIYGVLKRMMPSRYEPSKIIGLVQYDSGKTKWHSVNVIKPVE